MLPQDYIDDESEEAEGSTKKVASTYQKASQATRAIELLGGADNIIDVDACMTRLRVTVKDASLVGDLSAWKQNGAIGLVCKNNGVQAIYGPQVDVLKSEVQDLLGK